MVNKIVRSKSNETSFLPGLWLAKKISGVKYWTLNTFHSECLNVPKMKSASFYTLPYCVVISIELKRLSGGRALYDIHVPINEKMTKKCLSTYPRWPSDATIYECCYKGGRIYRNTKIPLKRQSMLFEAAVKLVPHLPEDVVEHGVDKKFVLTLLRDALCKT